MAAPVETVSRSLPATLFAILVLSGAAIWCGVLLKMTWSGAIGLYFVVWWTVLFAVLPWGVRSQQEDGAIAPGSDPGAPAIPNVRRKLVWTTIIAGLVFALWYVVYTYRLIALDDLAALLGVVPR